MFSSEVTDEDLVACGAKDSTVHFKSKLNRIQNGETALPKWGGL